MKIRLFQEKHNVKEEQERMEHGEGRIQLNSQDGSTSGGIAALELCGTRRLTLDDQKRERSGRERPGGVQKGSVGKRHVTFEHLRKKTKKCRNGAENNRGNFHQRIGSRWEREIEPRWQQIAGSLGEQDIILSGQTQESNKICTQETI